MLVPLHAVTVATFECDNAVSESNPRAISPPHVHLLAFLFSISVKKGNFLAHPCARSCILPKHRKRKSLSAYINRLALNLLG
jgi:hypothetical protein